MDNHDDYNDSACEDDVEEVNTFICVECKTLSNTNQQVYKNYHCGHRLCEMCRLLQQSKCKSCMESEHNVSVEELKTFICFECDSLCDASQQFYKNDHCDHRLCEMCRYFQESKCKSCMVRENNDSASIDDVEELNTFVCVECDNVCNAKLQVFENDHCGHRLCEMCRFLQESKCKSCMKNEKLVPELKQDKYDTSESRNALLKAKKKRNSLKSYQHIIPVEGDPGKYTCTVCEREIKHTNVSYHFSCISEKKPLSCDQCEKSFVKKNHLESHRLSHLGIKPFKCSQCPKAFMQKDKLKRHEKTHSDERAFTCDICSKSFKLKEDYKKHLTTHSDTRKYKCDVCSRAYKNKRNLTSHKLKHSETKNFTCETCGRRFTLHWQLTAHRKRHQSKRHFKCTECGRRFYTLQNLKRHQQTHSVICDYECSICNTAFKRKDNLERHMKNLHVEPPLVNLPQAVPTDLTCKTIQSTSQKQITASDVPSNNASELNCDKQIATNSKPSVIVSPKTPKSCPVSVIVSPQKTKIEKTSESPKLLPYRILPPDKRFLQMNENKNCVPTIMNLKAMHIVRTSDTGESNVETIVMTDDRCNQVNTETPKMLAVDAQADFCRKVSQGKDDKMNKCFRIINYPDSILANKTKDKLLPKKSLKYRNSCVDKSQNVQLCSTVTSEQCGSRDTNNSK